MIADIIDRHDMNPRLRTLLDGRIESRQMSAFYIYPGLSQAEAIHHTWNEIQAVAELIGDSAYRCLSDLRNFKKPIGLRFGSVYGRAQRGLDSIDDPGFLAKIGEVTEFFARAEVPLPAHIWMNKTSNVGYPRFTSSRSDKLEMFNEGLHKIREGDELPNHSFLTPRIQPDSVVRGSDNRLAPKARNWMYTKVNVDDIKTTTGIDLMTYPNARVEGDMVFGETIGSTSEPFIQLVRPRIAQGVDLTTNAIAQVIAQTKLDTHFVSEDIYILRDPLNLEMWVKGKYTSAIDFDNFDQTVSGRHILKIFEVLSFVQPKLSAIYERMYNSYVNIEYWGIDMLQNERGKYNTVYNRVKSEPDSIFGIVSGYGLTHIFGKIIGTAFTAWCLEKIGIKTRTLDDYANYIKNCGDDNLVRFDTESDKVNFDHFVLEQTQMKCSLENPKKYLGYEVHDSGGVSDGVTMSAASYLANSLCPEREAGSSGRKYATYGLAQRWEEYSSSFKKGDLLDRLSAFHKRLTEAIPNFEEIVAQEEEESKVNKDVEYLLKKYGLTKIEEIYYKLKTNDLPKEDLEIFAITVPIEEIIEIIPEIA